MGKQDFNPYSIIFNTENSSLKKITKIIYSKKFISINLTLFIYLAKKRVRVCTRTIKSHPANQ
jgi:hypothetical protein